MNHQLSGGDNTEFRRISHLSSLGHVGIILAFSVLFLCFFFPVEKATSCKNVGFAEYTLHTLDSG